MNLLDQLKQIDQQHIVDAYNQATPEQQKALQQQLQKLNSTYPGGLKKYYQRATSLLYQAVHSINPYDSYKVGVPNGVTLDFNNLEMIQKYETIGMKQLQHACFVLVAGGLGQRLGYPGIKVGIPLKLLTGKTFLHYYIDYILAFQKKHCPEGVLIPLVIMTSDDTYAQTIKLLEEKNNYGMPEQQITIIKQQKVPALRDSKARFSLLKNELLIQTKPHGHGDIHTLLYQHGLVSQWGKKNKKWIIYFQDTNPLAFRSFTALLGISEDKNFDFNSIGIPRKPGQAVGAITSLIHKQTGKTLTINVQYNQLEALFKQSGGQKTDQNGYSVFPGNTNIFVIKLSQYNKILQETQGNITEFINPKFKDQTKTQFKSSARLQCMMQDYPKLLPNCDLVGFTMIDRAYCFTTAKNDPASAAIKAKSGLAPQSLATCEADFYSSNRLLLRQCGADIQEGQPVQFGQIKLNLYPVIALSPEFATSLTEMRKKVKKLKVSGKSSLIISTDCILEDVQVDGHAEINKEGKIEMSELNKNYRQFVSTQGHEQPHLIIRKYKLKVE